MANYWLVVGIPENWKEAFKRGNIWGLKETQRHYWERMQEGDVVLFYATYPISGVIGYGHVQTKFRQDKPLWPEEISTGTVIWPLRFEFNVEYCLPPDKFNTGKATSNTIRSRARSGFQAIEIQLAQQLISKLKSDELYRKTQTEPQYIREESGLSPHGPKPEGTKSKEISIHEELKQKLLDIGKLQNYVAEAEYSLDVGKIDVVWRRIEGSVPTYVFEVQIGGDIYHALAKLKHAYDLWNSHIFLVAPQADRDRAMKLLAGTFHEISGRVKIIEPEEIEELYKRKRSYLDLERQLGITL